MKKRLYTTTELFKLIMAQLKEEGKVPNTLEYAIPDSEKSELRDYEFDVLGVVNYGGNEGIYIDLFYRGNAGIGFKDRQHIGTIKTLDRSDEAFHRMAALMADFQIAATRFIAAHLDDFTWTGYDIDYFKQGESKPSRCTTYKGAKSLDEAVFHAKKTMQASRPPRYDKAVITDNATGKTKEAFNVERFI